MNIPLTEWFGYIAATLTTISFAPQAFLTWKTRRVDGISLGMYTTFTIGVAFWLIYGWLIRSWPMVAANILTLVMAGFILVMKIRHGGK